MFVLITSSGVVSIDANNPETQPINIESLVVRKELLFYCIFSCFKNSYIDI